MSDKAQAVLVVVLLVALVVAAIAPRFGEYELALGMLVVGFAASCPLAAETERLRRSA